MPAARDLSCHDEQAMIASYHLMVATNSLILESVLSNDRTFHTRPLRDSLVAEHPTEAGALVAMELA